MTLTNPFFHRGPVRDRAYFFGREPETGQILSLLANSQSISIVGQRRIGKTSLLLHLSDPKIFERHGLNLDEHLFVYIDSGGLSDLDQPALFRVILEELDDALAENSLASNRIDLLDRTNTLTYRAFERALRDLTRQGWKPTILLDEFERMSQNPQLDPGFFSGLRALAAKYPISYVTASKQPLLELTYADISTLSSPFFNIFASIRLALFSDKASRNLVTGLATRVPIAFRETTLDVIFELAGPHPLFLQIAGFHACELRQARGAALTDEDLAALRDRFRASVEEHFAYYWRSLSEVEQRVLATLPASQHTQPDIVQQLEQACLIIRQDGNHDYLSPTFRDYIQAQALPGLLQAGPVVIDEDQRQALLHGYPLELTATQYTLLVHLAQQVGQVVTTETLEQAVWGDEYIEDPERLKSVIKGLRRALGKAATHLENVRGIGYVWRAGTAASS